MVAGVVTAGTGISAGIAFFVGATALAAFWSYYSRNDLILRVAGNVARQDELCIFEDTLKKDPSFVLQAYQWQEALAKYRCWDCCLYGAERRSVRLEIAIRRVIEEDGRLPPWGADLLHKDLPPREGRITLRKRAEATQRKTLTHETSRALPLAIELATVIIDEIEDDVWAHHSNHNNQQEPPSIDKTVPTHISTNYGGPGHASTPGGGDEWPPTRIHARRESYCKDWDNLSADRESELADDTIPSVSSGSSFNRPPTPATSSANPSRATLPSKSPSLAVLRNRVFTPVKSRLGRKKPAEETPDSGPPLDHTLDEHMNVRARLLKNTKLEDLLKMRQPTSRELAEQKRKFEISMNGAKQQLPAEDQPNPPLAYVALANLRINGQPRALPSEDNIEDLRPITIEIRRRKAIRQRDVEQKLQALKKKQAQTLGGALKRLCCCGVLCCCCGCCKRRPVSSSKQDQHRQKKESSLVSRMCCGGDQPAVLDDVTDAAPEAGDGRAGDVEMVARKTTATRAAEPESANPGGSSAHNPQIRDLDVQPSRLRKASTAADVSEKGRHSPPGGPTAGLGSQTGGSSSNEAIVPADVKHGTDRVSRPSELVSVPKKTESHRSPDRHKTRRAEDVVKPVGIAGPHPSPREPAKSQPSSKERESSRRSRARDAASGSATQQDVAREHEAQPQQPSGLALTGLRNFGSTCYMNATLQCLSGVIPLSTFLLRRDRCEKFCRTYRHGEESLLLSDYTALIRSLWRQNGGYLDPTAFRETCGLLKPEWEEDVQQDAMEFLDFILQGLHHELRQNRWEEPPAPLVPDEEIEREAMPVMHAAVQEWQRGHQYWKSLIYSLFAGQHASRICCSNCEHTITSFEVIFDIRTELPRYDLVSIYDCLDAYFEEETVEFTCPGCNVRCDASKRLSLTMAPEILIIQFKRFELDPGGWLDKIDAKVEVPLDNLDMTQYGEFEESQSGPLIYEAFALIKHDGTFDAGHYTSLVRSPESKNWFEFNDRKVTPLKMGGTETMASRRTYIIFYQRRHWYSRPSR